MARADIAGLAADGMDFHAEQGHEAARIAHVAAQQTVGAAHARPRGFAVFGGQKQRPPRGHEQGRGHAVAGDVAHGRVQADFLSARHGAVVEIIPARLVAGQRHAGDVESGHHGRRARQQVALHLLGQLQGALQPHMVGQHRHGPVEGVDEFLALVPYAHVQMRGEIALRQPVPTVDHGHHGAQEHPGDGDGGQDRGSEHDAHGHAGQAHDAGRGVENVFAGLFAQGGKHGLGHDAQEIAAAREPRKGPEGVLSLVRQVGRAGAFAVHGGEEGLEGPGVGRGQPFEIDHAFPVRRMVFIGALGPDVQGRGPGLGVRGRRDHEGAHGFGPLGRDLLLLEHPRQRHVQAGHAGEMSFRPGQGLGQGQRHLARGRVHGRIVPEHGPACGSLGIERRLGRPVPGPLARVVVRRIAGVAGKGDVAAVGKGHGGEKEQIAELDAQQRKGRPQARQTRILAACARGAGRTVDHGAFAADGQTRLAAAFEPSGVAFAVAQVRRGILVPAQLRSPVDLGRGAGQAGGGGQGAFGRGRQHRQAEIHGTFEAQQHQGVVFGRLA